MNSRSFCQRIEKIKNHPPVFCIYPEVLKDVSSEALASLPTPFYAVKANTHPIVLNILVESGWKNFDVASLTELNAVQVIAPQATCGFMNPVKRIHDIAQSYIQGVRMFAVDSLSEINKILAATNNAKDWLCVVRLSLEPNKASYSMTGKFGVDTQQAITLLQHIQLQGLRKGLTFHVGSQSEHPGTFANAIEYAAQVAKLAGVPIEVLDIGGGFPARYRNSELSYEAIADEVQNSYNLHRQDFSPDCQLQSEPGRSVVARSGSVLTRVEARRESLIYLNAGLHDLLSELRWLPAYHPVRLANRESFAEMQGYALAGPTCDSGDIMTGPYTLPNDIREGDWVEIGFLGAYCLELVTPFNGFGEYQIAVMEGAPPSHICL